MKINPYILLVFFVHVVLTGCSEKLSIDTEIQGSPQIIEFTPTSGKAGTLVTVKGNSLRDVETATIGGVEAQIVYKLSQQEIVIVVPRMAAKSGKIALSTSRNSDVEANTRVESSQSFTVTYPTPHVKEFPNVGRVGNIVEILGTDLDIISQVLIGDKESEIIYQSEEELAVKVPFIIDDNATISLKYANQGGGVSEIQGDPDAFFVEKDQPEIDMIDQESLMERSLLTLSGTHLNLIEYIYFGEEKHKPISQEDNVIVFKVPTLSATKIVQIKVTYYNETKEIIIADACEIIRMKNLFAANQAIGTRRSKYGYGSMLNGDDASGNVVCTPCVLKDVAYHTQIDFAAGVNTSLDFAFTSPDNILNETKNNLKNYWCGSEALPNTSQNNTCLTTYKGFSQVQTKFIVLDSTQDAALIRQIRKEKDQLEITSKMFVDLVVNKSSVRTRKLNEKEGFVSSQVFDKGSVIVFYNTYKNKYGILDILDVYVDYNQDKNVNNGDKNNQGVAYIIFDLYYQR